GALVVGSQCASPGVNPRNFKIAGEPFPVNQTRSPEPVSSGIVGKGSGELVNKRSGGIRRSPKGSVNGLMPGVIAEDGSLELAARSHLMAKHEFLVPSAIHDGIPFAPDENRACLQGFDGGILGGSLFAHAISVRIGLDQKCRIPMWRELHAQPRVWPQG